MEINEIKKRLESIERLLMLSAKNVYNKAELSMWLGISEDRISHLVCAREIPYSKCNGKLYFEKERIERWLTSQSYETNEEMITKATSDNYLSRKKGKRTA